MNELLQPAGGQNGALKCSCLIKMLLTAVLSAVRVYFSDNRVRLCLKGPFQHIFLLITEWFNVEEILIFMPLHCWLQVVFSSAKEGMNEES